MKCEKCGSKNFSAYHFDFVDGSVTEVFCQNCGNSIVIDTRHREEYVSVRHLKLTGICDNTYYIFKTETPLKKGDIVLCKTKYGDNLGTCEGDSIPLSEAEYKMVCQAAGVKKITGKILGKYEYKSFEKCDGATENRSENVRVEE